MPRSKLARAPSSPPLDTVVDARSSPSGSHTAMAIFVPPKSRPRMTGESPTEYLPRGDAPLAPGGLVPGTLPSCSILLGQYPNYQMATRPQCNRLATVGRWDYAAGRPVLRSAGQPVPVRWWPAGPGFRGQLVAVRPWPAGPGPVAGWSRSARGRLVRVQWPAGPGREASRSRRQAAPGALRPGPPADVCG